MANVQDAKAYLVTGGLGEVAGMADLALQMSQPQVQMDTGMAIALCQLAQTGVESYRAAKEAALPWGAST